MSKLSLVYRLKRCTLGLQFVAVLLLLSNCGGNYQAPVSDRGEPQVNRAPIIAQTSSNESGGRVVER